MYSYMFIYYLRKFREQHQDNDIKSYNAEYEFCGNNYLNVILQSLFNIEVC